MSEFIPETSDEVTSFLPSDDEPPTPEDELAAMEATIEQDPDSDDLLVVEELAEVVGKSWMYDWQQMKFASGGGHGPTATQSLETIKMWIVKCLKTARDAHPIHPPEYGLERAFEVVGMHTNDVLSSDLERRVTEALVFHPRITDVRDFVASFDEVEESALIEFTVVLDDDTELPTEVVL